MRAVSRVVRVRTRLGVCVHFLLAAVQAEIILTTLKGRRGGRSCGTQGRLFGTNSPSTVILFVQVHSTLHHAD